MNISTIEKSVQEITLEKIRKSVQECCTLETIISTEQFLNLYYKQFPYSTKYFKQEWLLDTQIKEKKHFLAMLDEEAETVVFSRVKISLKRLDTYAKSLSIKEFQANWAELQLQLEGIDMIEISMYPSICEKIACLKIPFISTFSRTKEMQEVA